MDSNEEAVILQEVLTKLRAIADPSLRLLATETAYKQIRESLPREWRIYRQFAEIQIEALTEMGADELITLGAEALGAKESVNEDSSRSDRADGKQADSKQTSIPAKSEEPNSDQSESISGQSQEAGSAGEKQEP